MKFRRAYKGRGKHVYTIRPIARYMDQGLLRIDKGLHAEFELGFFDSVAAQKRYDWTDPERDLVERFLMAHDDWGRGLYLDSSEDASLAPYADPNPVVPMGADTAPELLTVCIASVETDGEAGMCGKPTVDGEFCADHVSMFAQAP